MSSSWHLRGWWDWCMPEYEKKKKKKKKKEIEQFLIEQKQYNFKKSGAVRGK